MELRPVVADSSSVLEAVARSIGGPVWIQGDLDVDVYRLARQGDRTVGPDLVARVFGPDVDRATLDVAVAVLQRLAPTRFPAERCATDDPVLELGDGRHVLVTEFVPSSPAPSPGFLFAWCAGLLGRLATNDAASVPSGGGWHRLGPTPALEIDQALSLVGHLGPAMLEVVESLAEADDGTGLPEALIHADLTPPNLVPQGDQAPVVVDWIGVGRGARIWPLAFLLYSAGPAGAQRVLERYEASVALTAEERSRLADVMIARPLCLDLWSVAYERMSEQQAVSRCRAHRARVESTTAALRARGRS